MLTFIIFTFVLFFNPSSCELAYCVSKCIIVSFHVILFIAADYAVRRVYVHMYACMYVHVDRYVCISAPCGLRVVRIDPLRFLARCCK